MQGPIEGPSKATHRDRSGLATWAAGGLITLAALANLASAPAGDPLPDAITLEDGRVMSLSGDYVFSAVVDMQRLFEYYGAVYLSFDEVARLDIDATMTQTGKKVVIDKFDVLATTYSNYYDAFVPSGLTETIGLTKPAKARLSVKSKVQKFKVYGTVYKDYETTLKLNSNLKFDDGTNIKLKVDEDFYTYGIAGYGFYEIPLNDNPIIFKPQAGSNMSKGLVQSLFQLPKKTKLLGSTRLRVKGDLPVPDFGTLALDITWVNETSGTCIFTAPTHLAGLGGKVKKSAKSGVITVTGPKGQSTKLTIEPDGSGKVRLGYGKWNVGPGTFQMP